MFSLEHRPYTWGNGRFYTWIALRALCKFYWDARVSSSYKVAPDICRILVMIL
jgi:hypothetical protein